MVGRAKQRKRLKIKVSLPPTAPNTRQGSSLPPLENLASMTELYHELDPDGDLVLETFQFMPNETLHDTRSEDLLTGCKDETADTQSQDAPEEPNMGDDSEFGGLALNNNDEFPAEEPPAESAADKATGTFCELPADNSLRSHSPATNADGKVSCQIIRIRVSSKHLTLASPVFKTMLQGKFKEGQELSSNGYAKLPLPDDDPAALLVLLNLIHGFIRKVPRQIGLRMLTQLAILVDKYELLETTEILFDYWLRGLEDTIPSALNSHLLPWMCISWVFQRPDVFKKVTKVAQLESEGLLAASELPVPESVLNDIDHYRQNILAKIFAYLESILKKYQGSERICDHGIKCDGMILGSLTIGLNAVKALQPPSPPYNGFSIKSLFQHLSEMGVPQYCNGDGYDSSQSRKCEGVKKPLEAKMKELEQQLRGVDLTDRNTASVFDRSLGEDIKKTDT